MTDYPVGLVFIFFVYGLAFFVMGLAVLLEVGRAPLLGEARVLRPLAVFGILHGIHEWLEIFILQAEWLGVELPAYWSVIRIVLLAISFVSLVAYGIQVLYPPKRLAATDAWIGISLLAVYAVIIFLFAPGIQVDFQDWVRHSDALARYLMAVPGAIMAGQALRVHASERQKQGHDDLARGFRMAAWGFLAYGLSQIFVSPVDFYPARFLNTESFLSWFGFPIQLLRGIIAVVITTVLIRVMQIIERERQNQLLSAKQERLEALERVQDELIKREKLRRELLRHTVITQEEERTRIARELHDESAQVLTAISLDVATLQNRAQGDPEVVAISKRLRSLSKNLSESLKRLVHDLRPAQLDDLGLIPALNYLIDESARRTGLQIRFQVEGKHHRLDPLVETVLYRVAQESLTNIVRHAKTDKAEIKLEFDTDWVRMWTRDEGVGFTIGKRHPTQIGWGIAGMRERVRSVGGEFKLHSAPGKGTRIEVSIPLNIKIQGEKRSP